MFVNAIDDEICTKLWNENVCRIRKICQIKLRSYPDEIEDVLSEVFLAFCEKTSKNGIPEKPTAWLYGTLNNLINLKYREIYKFKSNNANLLDKEYELPFQEDVIEEKIDEIYKNEIINKLKQLLTSDEYQLIQYIYFDKRKMREIAKILNTSEAAVKQKHYRICNKLRKIAKYL